MRPRAPRSSGHTTHPAAAAQPIPGEGAWSFLVVEQATSRTVSLPRAGSLIIGRGDAADLRLEDASVSRRHARIDVGPSGVRVIDLESRNGMRVGGAPFAGERALVVGDVLAVGDVTLILRGPSRPRGAEPAEARPAPQVAEEASVVSLALGDHTVVLADPAMIRLFALIERLAAATLPVLVVGETGVGKEHAAFAVHRGSARREAPFICVNCAAIPDSLLESELFGHERGAFSGAHAAREGLFERAAGGTLFLDEVGELSPAAQAKLLRVLEGGHFARVGDTRERRADVRVVAATNRDLAAEVKARRFREDLLFRLNSAVVLIPPLRERPADIPVLARRFLAAARVGAGARPLALTPEAMRALTRHAWPGNVRELRNAMEYVAAAVPEGAVERSSLPDTITAGAKRAPTPPPAAELRPIAEELEELERGRMREALAAAGGVKTRAARLISMPERTFRLKLRQYGLDRAGDGDE